MNNKNRYPPEIDEIIPNIFVGNINAAASPDILHQYGIQTIVRVNDHDASPATKQMYEDMNINYIYHFQEDWSNSSIKSLLGVVPRQIHDASNAPVLVHCEAGRSRSVSMIIAYLMLYHGYTVHSAYILVKEKHPQAEINMAFFGELFNLDRA